MKMAGVGALRRLNARSFANAALPPQQKSAAAASVASATATMAVTSAARVAVPNAGTIARKKKQSKDSRFATVGLPLLLFVAGGYVALTQASCCFVLTTGWRSLRMMLMHGLVVCLSVCVPMKFVGGKFEARDHIIKSHTAREFDLEEEHKKMTKKLVLDDFEIKPVPKPGESTK